MLQRWIVCTDALDIHGSTVMKHKLVFGDGVIADLPLRLALENICFKDWHEPMELSERAFEVPCCTLSEALVSGVTLILDTTLKGLEKFVVLLKQLSIIYCQLVSSLI